MAARVSLGPSVDAVPGEPATCDLVVENTTDAADVFSFGVEGEPSRWTTVSPSRLHVDPGERGVALVTCFIPRRPDPPAGAVILRVHVASRVERWRALSADTVVRIARFVDVSAELGPPVSTGWRCGNHTVTVRNRGNAPVVARLGARRSDDDLVVTVEPVTLAVQPGATGVALVTATCRSRLTRGPEQRHRFALVVDVDGMPPMGLEGEMLQQPRGWLRKVPVDG